MSDIEVSKINYDMPIKFFNNKSLIEHIDYDPVNDLNILRVNGYFYRGGQTGVMREMTSLPLFFGTFESAKSYTDSENKYTVKIKTKNTLKLLNLNLDFNDNITKIHNFFNTTIRHRILPASDPLFNRPEMYDKIVSFALVLLQFAFGLIADTQMSNLNFYGLKTKTEDNLSSLLELEDEFFKQIIPETQWGNKMNKIKIGNVGIIPEMLDDIYNSNMPDWVISSRCSIRNSDKTLMFILKYLLKPFDIDGIAYIKPRVDNSDNICMLVNRIYKETFGDLVETCVATEICIFDPFNKVDIISNFIGANEDTPILPRRSDSSNWRSQPSQPTRGSDSSNWRVRGGYKEKYEKYVNKCKSITN